MDISAFYIIDIDTFYNINIDTREIDIFNIFHHIGIGSPDIWNIGVDIFGIVGTVDKININISGSIDILHDIHTFDNIELFIVQFWLPNRNRC